VIDMEKRRGRWRTPRPPWVQALAPVLPALGGIALLVVLALTLRAPWRGRAASVDFLAVWLYVLWATSKGRI
jgi:hypothetical protein